jgi:transposase
MSKYSIELRQEVINHYLSGQDGYQLTAERFCVPRSSVRMWIAAYQAHSAASLIKRRVIYSTDFKISVVQHMQQHSLSLLATAAHFNIPEPSSNPYNITVAHQIKQFLNSNEKI